MGVWSIAALKEHFDQRMADNDRRVELAFHAAERATDKAETAMTIRLDQGNEVREELREVQGRFVLQEVYDQDRKRLNALDNQLANLSGRLFALAGVGSVIGGGVMALIVSLVAR